MKYLFMFVALLMTQSCDLKENQKTDTHGEVVVSILNSNIDNYIKNSEHSKVKIKYNFSHCKVNKEIITHEEKQTLNIKHEASVLDIEITELEEKEESGNFKFACVSDYDCVDATTVSDLFQKSDPDSGEPLIIYDDYNSIIFGIKRHSDLEKLKSALSEMKNTCK